MLAPARGSILVDDTDRLPHQTFDMLSRVGDGRTGGDEEWIGAVMTTDATQPANHARNMRSKNSTEGVDLVDDHVTEVREERRPTAMVGQDGGMQHVRIAQDDPSRAA